MCLQSLLVDTQHFKREKHFLGGAESTCYCAKMNQHLSSIAMRSMRT